MQRRQLRTENRLRLFDPSEGLSGHDDHLVETFGESPVPAGRGPSGPGAAQSRPDVHGNGSLFLPQGYEPNYRYPLLIWLPDSRASRFQLGRVMSRVSLRNHVAILPAGLAISSIAAPAGQTDIAGGNHGDTEAAVWDALARAHREASIDPSRTFLVGQGDGGTEAFRIGCRHADSFGGIISIDGGFPDGESAFSRLDRVRRLPMLICCRKDSEIARGLDRTLRLFHAAGGSLAVRLYPSVGCPTDAMLGDVNRWVMEQVCGGSEARCPVAT